MSLVLNMVGGGGGLSPSNITIHVNAPIGSTVELSLSGNVVKTILPNKALTNSDGRTADYYYSTSITGTYTVTALLGSLSPSKTVTVSSAGEYDVTIKFLLLYDYGDECSDLTGGWSYIMSGAGTVTLTKNADNMVLSGSTTVTASTNACVNMENLIDVSGFSTFKILYDLSRTGSGDPAEAGLRKNVPTTNGGYDGNDNFLAHATLYVGTNLTGSVSISNVTVPACAYVIFWAHKNYASSVTVTIKRVWLE